jgi:hypothetical protein
MSDPSSPVQSNRLKTWYEKATTLPDKFNPNVSMKDVFYNAPIKIIDACHFYSFPLGLLSIINFLTIFGILFLAVYVAYNQAKVGGLFNYLKAIVYGLLIILSGSLLNIFMFYVQAYLIKGCQCAKINSKKNLNANPENTTPLNANP